jgi:hypothetical protein
MVEDFRITGGAAMKRAALVVLANGTKKARLEMLAAIRAEVKPIIEDQKQAARATLPKRGGLNEVVAGAKFGSRTRISKATGVVGVKIVAKGKPTRDIEAIDRGRVRHKTFGHKPWKDQRVEPGFFTKPAEKAAPRVTAGLVVAMEKVVHDIERESH